MPHQKFSSRNSGSLRNGGCAHSHQWALGRPGNSSPPPVVPYCYGRRGLGRLHGELLHVFVGSAPTRYWIEHGRSVTRSPDELGLFAAVSIALSLGSLLSTGSVLIFVDNGAAALALTKGAFKRPLAQGLISAFWLLATKNSINFRTDRAHSARNPADDPSRVAPQL